MKSLSIFIILVFLITLSSALSPLETLLSYAVVGGAALPNSNSYGCINFTPFVDNLNPNFGPSPSNDLIDKLLNNLVAQTPYRCIQIYDINNAYMFEAAKARGFKVISVIWLVENPAANVNSINVGIQRARNYKDTIIGFSCGSELRYRTNKVIGENAIFPCISALKNAGVTQPVTSNDIKWSFCNGQLAPCNPWTELRSKVDYIGLNLFPWWENVFEKCIPNAQVPQRHLEEYDKVKAGFPNTPIIVTEFGWPGGPEKFEATNKATGRKCGAFAGEKEQNQIIRDTIALFRQRRIGAVAFSSFREPWKVNSEDVFAAFWGLCNGSAPYTCKNPFQITSPPPPTLPTPPTTFPCKAQCKFGLCCSRQCYSPAMMKCTGEVACMKSMEGCGKACYDPRSYICRNGQLSLKRS